ncbi:hypothetical protein EVAR_47441_1 [Eumeta japonica]|uniref:Uncharacterized protein n=1 Tax=Eumeta variegata TaxID=151549 RepID=A0A4C1XBX8_EUMVA|nr:hypothetical protein EVAR_47441_1 [Eumeta japonica]
MLRASESTLAVDFARCHHFGDIGSHQIGDIGCIVPRRAIDVDFRNGARHVLSLFYLSRAPPAGAPPPPAPVRCRPIRVKYFVANTFNVVGEYQISPANGYYRRCGGRGPPPY